MLFAYLKKYDYVLISAIFLLCFSGLLMVYSASYPLGISQYGDARYFIDRQLKSFFIGLVLFMIAALFPHRLYARLSPIIVMVSIVLLVLVLVPGIGVERNFSQRWIQIGSFMFQPSEAVKLGMIIYFASIYTKKQEYIDHFGKGILPPLLILGFVCLLILKQPDLGTATSVLLTCGMILLCSGARRLHLFMLAGVASLSFVYFAFSETYRLKRILSFLDPFQDPQGDGYQLINSYFAIALGGIKGNGLGESVQKLGYLPEAHTDFIMAITIEELGILGLLLILTLYFLIMYRGIRISIRLKDTFSKLLAIGLTSHIIIQVFFNLGAVSGLLPITGIPLPFVSYGGSSLILMMISGGMLAQLSAST